MTWTHEALAERVVEICRTQPLEVGDDFGPRSNLLEAGLESLAVTQLLLAIEEATGVWVDESELTPETLATPWSLAGCIHAHLGNG